MQTMESKIKKMAKRILKCRGLTRRRPWLQHLNRGLTGMWLHRMALRILQFTCSGKSAEIAVDQIRTISKKRLGRKLGALSESEAYALRRVIPEMYGD